MKKFLMLIFTLTLLNSCNFNINANYENEKTEKENAESVISLFYLYTSRNSFDESINLFSDSFFKISSREKLKNFLEEKKKTLGDFKDYSLVYWKTNRITGANPKTEYLMVYEVKYTNYNATEAISLIKEDEKVKIIGYNVNKK